MLQDELLAQANHVRMQLREATIKYAGACFDQIQAKQEYERRFSEALAQGELMGRNEDTRAGEFSLKYPDLVGAYENCELAVILARKELDVARIEDAYLSRLIVVHLETNQDAHFTQTTFSGAEDSG